MSVNKKRTGVGIGVALVQWLSDDRNSLSVSDVRKNLVEFNCFYCRDADDDDVTIFENSQLQRSTQKFTDLHIFSYLLFMMHQPNHFVLLYGFKRCTSIQI
ncbi:uncharacterized protein LOC107853686 isoform X9 [Capsicum annuum]|uniref:uncharacterized protein LOC107853686 isoform X9 n=1 Tax=Capsicum annuum TaxID=4072 RepID=UPI001FB1172F|nr:uncharacterized protein LOC107853686 isoform X9 [Capsicum annuum]